MVVHQFWHSSLVLVGKERPLELFFDGQIRGLGLEADAFTGRPVRPPSHKGRDVTYILMKPAASDVDALALALQVKDALQSHFCEYAVLTWNCNHFTTAACTHMGLKDPTLFMFF